MTVSPPAPTDAASLAASVRQLALQAHRVLSDPASDPAEARELSRRASGLRSQLRGRSTLAVERWLDSLERKLQVESLACID